MQTKEQFLNRVKEMTGEQFQEWILSKAEKAYNSGAFDSENYEDNYMLPKIFMSALGEEIKFQYNPLSKEGVKERDNLINFL